MALNQPRLLPHIRLNSYWVLASPNDWQIAKMFMRKEVLMRSTKYLSVVRHNRRKLRTQHGGPSITFQINDHRLFIKIVASYSFDVQRRGWYGVPPSTNSTS